MFCFLTSVLGLNFFIALGVTVIMNIFFESKTIPFQQYIAYFISMLAIGFYLLYVALAGWPSGSLIGGDFGSKGGTSYTALLELGLVAGMLTYMRLS